MNLKYFLLTPETLSIEMMLPCQDTVYCNCTIPAQSAENFLTFSVKTVKLVTLLENKLMQFFVQLH